MHRCTVVTLLALLLSLGCRDPAPSGPADLAAAGPAVFTDDVMGVSMEIPTGWKHTPHDGRHLFAGPPETEHRYTTITLQNVPHRGALDEALLEAYLPVRHGRGFAWKHREPTTVDSRPAFRYAVTFELNEQSWHKMGVLIDAGRNRIDLSYAATAQLFTLGVPQFESALNSVHILR